MGSIFSGIGLLAVVVVVAAMFANRNISRFYRFAPYANAVRHYEETIGPLPSRIERIEEEYNRFDRRVCQLPPSPATPRPIYRPVAAGCAREGRFLVMIEATPVEWHSWFDRYIIYADCQPGDARVYLEHIWIWDLVDRIAADDAHRREVCEPDGDEADLTRHAPDTREAASRPAG